MNAVELPQSRLYKASCTGLDHVRQEVSADVSRWHAGHKNKTAGRLKKKTCDEGYANNTCGTDGVQTG